MGNTNSRSRANSSTTHSYRHLPAAGASPELRRARSEAHAQKKPDSLSEYYAKLKDSRASGGLLEPPPSYDQSQTDPQVSAGPSRSRRSRRSHLEYIQTPLRQESMEDALQTLSQYDTVLIVDDSGSMAGSLWREATNALSKLASIAAQYDTDGINIHFINDWRSGIGIKRAEEVQQLFLGVSPRGATPLGRKLEYLTSVYLEKLENAKREGGVRAVMETCKPMNYVVITDGQPTDDVVGPIKNLAQRLDQGNFSLTQVGIQFLQIGTDAQATKFLKSLDDDLQKVYHIRDIVDCTPYIGTLTADMITKILLGGINRRIDVEGSKSVL
ncbi:hypothetical protein EW146_g6008 [Bondarzewia mesenterica]|uniref:VWFA domain-containing protein n=1 Tax=Bondarzewia mesenterica TaxID=1095465 RepID=A0A4S4LRM4_9AGAM|nr:hypothetical protein EW146_g6008 [Bondarzewia mesenterica]